MPNICYEIMARCDRLNQVGVMKYTLVKSDTSISFDGCRPGRRYSTASAKSLFDMSILRPPLLIFLAVFAIVWFDPLCRHGDLGTWIFMTSWGAWLHNGRRSFYVALAGSWTDLAEHMRPTALGSARQWLSQLTKLIGSANILNLPS